MSYYDFSETALRETILEIAMRKKPIVLLNWNAWLFIMDKLQKDGSEICRVVRGEIEKQLEKDLEGRDV